MPGREVRRQGTTSVLYVAADRSMIRRVEATVGDESSLRITSETDPQKALAQLAEGLPACAVVDQDMRGMSGIEFTRRVTDEYPELPIIMFTCDGDEIIASRAISAGVTDYIPATEDEESYRLLADRVKTVIENDRAADMAGRLNEQVERFLQIFPGVAFAITEDGRYVDLIAGSESSLLCADPNTIVGNQFEEVLPDEKADRFQNVVHEVLETGDRQRIEYELEVQAGQRWFEAEVGPLRTRGERDAVFWAARDITHQKRREQEYKQIFDSVRDAIAVLHPETANILDVNDAYLQMVKYENLDQLQQLGIDGLSATDEGYTSERAREIVRRVARQETEDSVEWRIERSDDERRWIEVNLTTAEIGGVDRVLAIHRDITERKRREQRLDVFNRVLRHNIRHQADIIKSHAQALQDSTSEPHTNQILAASDRLLAVSRRARTIERALSSGITEQRVRLSECIDETLSRVERAQAGTELNVCVPEEGELVTDKQLLIAGLESVVDNALTYADSRVTISANRVSEGWVITIEDDGDGIPEKELRVLQSGTETDLHHSRGLGLWQLKWVIERIDGSLRFETDTGTTVEISVPHLDAEAAVEPTEK